jgi:DNA-binding transcriptional MerR regulator
MNQPKDLLSIGTFANLTRLSIKALRLYDDLGILQPRHIDPQSGYRYYGINQLPSARMIRNMRDMDMPLATIRRVLAVLPVSQAQAELLVHQHLELRERQLEQIKKLARQFNQQLKPEANTMELEVSVRDIPTQQIISITRHHKVDGLSKQIDHDIGALFSLANDYGARPAGTLFGIYHGRSMNRRMVPWKLVSPWMETSNAEKISKSSNWMVEGSLWTIYGDQCHFPELLGAYDAAVIGSEKWIWLATRDLVYGARPRCKMGDRLVVQVSKYFVIARRARAELSE